MTQAISPIIKPTELASLAQSGDLVIIDARVGADAKKNYIAAHLSGAFFVDMNTDLAEVPADPANGGRHPLPDPKKFEQVVKRLGIGLNTAVVVYDDKNGSNAAARFWWMLRAAGHKHVQVLDGGYDAAVKAGFPLSANEEIPTVRESMTINNWLLPMVDMNQVETAVKDNSTVVIDVRSKERFDGIKEPFDRIAGHIPGATNIPFESNLDDQGFFLPALELKEKYTGVMMGKDPDKVIVHCGSGVTACHTLLAMDYAGIEIPKLYVGSWSEWCNTKNKPVATIK